MFNPHMTDLVLPPFLARGLNWGGRAEGTEEDMRGFSESPLPVSTSQPI